MRKFVFFIVILIGLGLVSVIIYDESLNGSSSNTDVPPTTATSTPISTSSTPTSTGSTPGIPSSQPTSSPAQPVTPPLPPIPVVKIPTGDFAAYQFGIAAGDTLPAKSEQDLEKELNDIASLGIGWIRFDMAWNDIQYKSGVPYNWSDMDRIIAAATARNIKVLPDLGYTPPWAGVSGCEARSKCEPGDFSLFAAFAKAAVQRYAPKGVSDWEIWNEPNNGGFWQPAPNVADYAALLKVTYIAIKSVQPSSTVITGGLAPELNSNESITPVDFLTQLYADGAEPYFDAVGMHPYSYPAMPSYYAPWNAWEQMFATNPSLRSVMTANGDANKKIWMTEFGAPTGGPGVLETSTYDTTFTGSPDHVTENVQSQMFAQAMNLIKSYPWAGPLFFYSYKDVGTSPSTNENFFGIVRFDGSVKPAYTTIQELLAPRP